MNELILLYTVLSYLFTIGCVFSVWDEYQDERRGLIMWLILSPIITPIYLGIAHTSNNN